MLLSEVKIMAASMRLVLVHFWTDKESYKLFLVPLGWLDRKRAADDDDDDNDNDDDEISRYISRITSLACETLFFLSPSSTSSCLHASRGWEGLTLVVAAVHQTAMISEAGVEALYMCLCR